MKPIKLKKLNIKKLDNILSKLATIGIVNCKDFIKVLNKKHKLLDYVDFKLLPPQPTLQISIRNYHSNEFIIIPIPLVKGNIDSYNKFLEHWELFRREFNTKLPSKPLSKIKDMVEMNSHTFYMLTMLMKLKLPRQTEALLTNSTPKQAAKSAISVNTINDINHIITISIANLSVLDNSIKKFEIDINNPKEFISEWNEFRSKYFL